MYKIFPYTKEGDQIIVEFEYIEERDAFEAVVRNIKDHLETATPEKEGAIKAYRDFKFKSTLQATIASDSMYRDAICEILDIDVLNAYSKDNVVIIQYI